MDSFAYSQFDVRLDLFLCVANNHNVHVSMASFLLHFSYNSFHAQVIDYYYYFYIFCYFCLVFCCEWKLFFSSSYNGAIYIFPLNLHEPAGCKSIFFGLFLPFLFPSMAFKWPSHAHLDEKNTSIVNKLLQFFVYIHANTTLSLNGVNFDDAGQTVGFILPFYFSVCKMKNIEKKKIQTMKKQ